MTANDFYTTFFDEEGEYVGPKYSGYIFLEEDGTIMETLCKRGDVEEEFPCTTYGPMRTEWEF